MDRLSDLDPDTLSQLSNEDFEESVKTEARSLSADAMSTYEDIMNNGEDEKARVLAADRVLALSGVDSDSKSLPSGVSEEVFKIAISGLVQLSRIAQFSSTTPQIFRDVTPARTDPRKSDPLPIPSLSSIALPTSGAIAVPDIPTIVSKERYEIKDRSLFHDEV